MDPIFSARENIFLIKTLFPNQIKESHLSFARLLLEYWYQDLNPDYCFIDFNEEVKAITLETHEQGCTICVVIYEDDIKMTAIQIDENDYSNWTNWSIWAQGGETIGRVLDAYQMATRTYG